MDYELTGIEKKKEFLVKRISDGRFAWIKKTKQSGVTLYITKGSDGYDYINSAWMAKYFEEKSFEKGKKKFLTNEERASRSAKSRQTWINKKTEQEQKAHNVAVQARDEGKTLYYIVDHSGVERESAKAYCFEMIGRYGNPRLQWIPKACVNNVDKDTVTVLADFVNREMQAVDKMGAKYIWI